MENPLELTGNPLDRDTPGIFEIWAHDLEEARTTPDGLYHVGACEPDQLVKMDVGGYSSLAQLIGAAYDAHVAAGSPERTWPVWQESRPDEGDPEGPELIYLTFDMRQHLR